MRWNRVLALVLFAVLVCLGGCHHDHDDDPPPPPPPEEEPPPPGQEPPPPAPPAACPACTGQLDVVCPDFVTSAVGTCQSDPQGVDPITGQRDQNIPANPPADGLWVRGTPGPGCRDCRVFGTAVFLDAQGNPTVRIDPGGATGGPGWHPADAAFHRTWGFAPGAPVGRQVTFTITMICCGNIATDAQGPLVRSCVATAR